MTTAAQTNGATSAKPAPPARTNRMTLDRVTKGRITDKPKRILVHGVDGVGKSTFAACAPNPIFIGTEDGSEHLDVTRFPQPETWDDVLDAIRTLTETDHDHKTLTLDSLDWAEPMLWASICQEHGAKTIDDVGGGFGKGYTAALDGWRVFLSAIERLQRAKGMHVVLIAHSYIKVFKNPQGDDFDRYILKLNEKAAGLLREWCKGVYFANFETFAVKDKAKRVRGVSTGARLLYTQRTAAFDAKDRYGLPEEIPLSWDEFDKFAREGAGNLENLKTEIKRKAKEIGGDTEATILTLLVKAGDNAQSLALINDRLNAKLAEKQATKEN